MSPPGGAVWARGMALAAALARRDLALRARGSVFPGWSLLLPLAAALVSIGILGSVFRMRFSGPDGTEGAVWLPVLCGLLPWIQVHESVRRGVWSLAENAAWIRGLRFPMAALPAQSVLWGFLLEGILLAVLLPWTAAVAWPWGLLGLLAILPLQAAFAWGAAAAASVLQVYLRDLASMIALALPAWFYASPVLYAREHVPASLAWLAAANPVTPLAEAYRSALWLGTFPRGADLAALAAWAAAAMLAGGWLLGRLGPRIADEL